MSNVNSRAINSLTNQWSKLGSQLITLLAMAVTLLFGLASSYAHETFSTTEALDKLKAAKIVDPKFSLTLSMNDKEANVVVERNPKETENDCKIDALLVAKTLMAAYPAEILRIRVIFFVPKSDAVEQVIVTAGDIKSFNSGQIDRTALLESIEMEKVSDNEEVDQGQIGERTGVVSGEKQTWRLSTLARIQALSNKGVNVSAFTQEFDDLEKLVDKGRTPDLVAALRRLNDQLTEQNELTAQAQLPPVSNRLGFGSGGNRALAPIQARFNKRLESQVREKLSSLQQQGQSVTDWTLVLNRAESLAQSGQIENANRLLRRLARELGINPLRPKSSDSSQSNPDSFQTRQTQ